MALPFFYVEHIEAIGAILQLNEETSKHMVQVLRMNAGTMVSLTDGKGKKANVEVVDAHKKKCSVLVKEVMVLPPPEKRTAIAISLIKNTARFEWFLEKAAELGITTVYPLLCERTEKQHFRMDRMKGILVSAMLQSKQVWLAEIYQPISFADLIQSQTFRSKYIAYCGEEYPRYSLHQKHTALETLVLIGPEGDFTTSEVKQAIEKGFEPVTLGDNRLRTETAGVAAAVVLGMCF
jgi:16S rRNA (uracil1498-N3)-methyltransferase